MAGCFTVNFFLYRYKGSPLKWGQGTDKTGVYCHSQYHTFCTSQGCCRTSFTAGTLTHTTTDAGAVCTGLQGCSSCRVTGSWGFSSCRCMVVSRGQCRTCSLVYSKAVAGRGCKQNPVMPWHDVVIGEVQGTEWCSCVLVRFIADTQARPRKFHR